MHSKGRSLSVTVAGGLTRIFTAVSPYGKPAATLRNARRKISEFFQLVLPPVVRHSDGTGVASPELPNFLDPKPGRTAGQIRHTNIAFGAIHKSQPRACWRRAPAARAVAVVKTPKAGW